MAKRTNRTLWWLVMLLRGVVLPVTLVAAESRLRRWHPSNAMTND